MLSGHCADRGQAAHAARSAFWRPKGSHSDGVRDELPADQAAPALYLLADSFAELVRIARQRSDCEALLVPGEEEQDDDPEAIGHLERHGEAKELYSVYGHAA